MRVHQLIVALLVSIPAWPTTYYVSSSGGSDLNTATQAQSSATPWASLAHVSAQTFNAGDSILLKRGDTWAADQLIVPSSGSTGSPIAFDAYGTGAAPVITAAVTIPFVSGSWSYIAGSTWKATISSTVSSGVVNMVRFGSVYGRKQISGGSCSTVIASKYDFCAIWPNLYVYSPAGTNPVATYASEGAIVPIVGAAAGLQMISIAGKSWLTFQHIKVRDFDYIGIGISGASDNLVFANMESDGMFPYGATPHGFYVNATNPKNIQFLNDDAHLNYDGFHFDGTATAITLINCRGYANREAGLRDNTGVASYSYSHFYGNNVAQLNPNDVVGGIAAAGNVPSTVAPIVMNVNTYPARLSFTVDDVGSSPGTESYVNILIPVFSSRGMKFNAAVVPSYPVDWASVNNWYAAGDEIDSHSWSHQYYTTNGNPQNSPPYPNAPALDIRYTGSGTTATLTISGNVLSTTVDGSSDLSVDLKSSAYNTIAGLESYLATAPNYSVSYDASGPLVRPNAHSYNLLNVSSQDIKSANYVLLYDQTKLEPDELTSSKAAIQTNVSGLTETFYVYPDGIEDPTIEADAVAAGYTAARGSLAMKDQQNATAGANSLYSNGVNVQNITSLAAIQFHGLTQAQINQLVANVVFRASAWGAPYGLFTHWNSAGNNTPDITNTELGYILDAITAAGGTLMTNTALAQAITSGTNISGSTRYIQNATGPAVNLLTATAGSPTVGTGTVTSYPIDLNGVNRAFLGAWDIGASAYVSQRYGTASGSGQWKVQ